MQQKVVRLGISARHVHLCQEHVEKLFGPGYQLTKYKDLSQPGQFACEETVALATTKDVIHRVRVLGPVRSKTQVEISRTDAFTLGITPPVRDSGNVEDSPGVILIGPKGVVALEYGVILALRHIHMQPEDAAAFGVQDGDTVSVEIGEERKAIFSNVLIRVSPKYSLELHLDTDEANAAGVTNGAEALILPS